MEDVSVDIVTNSENNYDVQAITERSISLSNWCIECYEKDKIGAVVIYKGNSLCQDCFEKILK